MFDTEPTEIIHAEPVGEVAQAAEQTVETDAHAEPQNDDEPRRARGVQKRIDELTGNWRSTERERDHWREVAMQALQGQQAPIQEQVYDDQSYVDYGSQEQPLSAAALLQQAKELLRAEQDQQGFTQKVQSFKANVSDPEAQEFLDSEFAPITRVMSDVMLDREDGPQIAVWLSRNQSEAARIAALPAHKQVLALLEASQKVTVKPKVTGAPAPIETIGGRSAPNVDPDKMTTEQWMKWRQQNVNRG